MRTHEEKVKHSKHTYAKNEYYYKFVRHKNKTNTCECHVPPFRMRCFRSGMYHLEQMFFTMHIQFLADRGVFETH